MSESDHVGMADVPQTSKVDDSRKRNGAAGYMLDIVAVQEQKSQKCGHTDGMANAVNRRMGCIAREREKVYKSEDQGQQRRRTLRRLL